MGYMQCSVPMNSTLISAKKRVVLKIVLVVCCRNLYHSLQIYSCPEMEHKLFEMCVGMIRSCRTKKPGILLLYSFKANPSICAAPSFSIQDEPKDGTAI